MGAASEQKLYVAQIAIKRLAAEQRRKDKAYLDAKLEAEASRKMRGWSLEAVVRGTQFEMTVMVLILANVAFMAVPHHRQSDYVTVVCDHAEYVCTAFFCVEMLLKWAGLGMREYFGDPWCRFDFLIVATSLADVVIEKTVGPVFSPSVLRALRIMRLARIFRLLQGSQSIQSLLAVCAGALPQISNLLILLALLYLIFGCVGVELFGRIGCNASSPCYGLNEYSTYKDFPRACLTLFRVNTGDNVMGLLEDGLKQSPECDDTAACTQNCCSNPYLAALFYILFITCSKLIFVNIVIAMLCAHMNRATWEQTQGQILRGIAEADAAGYDANPQTMAARERMAEMKKSFELDPQVAMQATPTPTAL